MFSPKKPFPSDSADSNGDGGKSGMQAVLINDRVAAYEIKADMKILCLSIQKERQPFCIAWGQTNPAQATSSCSPPKSRFQKIAAAASVVAGKEVSKQFSSMSVLQQMKSKQI